jgi:hypothetical protein
LIRSGLDANHLSGQKRRSDLTRPHEVPSGDKPLQQSDAFGVYLVFAKGRRPSAAAIHAFAAAWEKVFVSHDPAMPSSPDGNPPNIALTGDDAGTGVLPVAKQWVEVLRDGLTFDLAGLAPGPACGLPAAAHRFDWSEGVSLDQHEAVLITAGPHIAGAESVVPVMRTMVGLARDMALFFEDMAGVIWPPSHSVIGRRFFESTATAWLDGGPFPALGLTAFELAEDGALHTIGLVPWAGHELRLDPALAQDKVAATRLGVRLINHIVMLGGLAQPERIVAPDGTRLVLVPPPDDGPIRVQRE